MKYNLFSKLAKLAIIIFIVVAVFRGNVRSITDFFNNIFVKNIQEENTQQTQPNNTLKKKAPIKKTLGFSRSEKGDFIDQKVYGVFDKLIENPHFYALLENSIKDNLSRQGRIIEKDPLFKTIIKQKLQNGKGNIAKCGDLVEIAYKIGDINKADLSRTKLSRTELIIGSTKNHLGIENSIIEMQTGEHIKAFFFDNLQPRTLSEIEKDTHQSGKTSEIKLLKIIKPHDKKTKLNIHFTRNAEPGSSLPLCGNDSSFRYTIRDLSNKTLYAPKNKVQNIKFDNNLSIELLESFLAAPMNNFSMTIIGTKKQIQKGFGDIKIFNLNKLKIKPNQTLIVNIRAL